MDETIEELLDSVEASSIALGETANALSQMLEQVDDRLRKRPGKIVARVESESMELSFANHKGWGLYLLLYPLAGNTPKRLTECSIELKCLAAALLPELLVEIERAQRECIEAIEKALKAYQGDEAPAELE